MIADGATHGLGDQRVQFGRIEHRAVPRHQQRAGCADLERVGDAQFGGFTVAVGGVVDHGRPIATRDPSGRAV